MPNMLDKIKTSLFCGLGCAILAALARVLYFIEVDDYALTELKEVGLYLISHQLNLFFMALLAASAVFATVWIFADRFEGLTISALFVLAWVVPIAWYINRVYLPGIREPKSILGNGIILVITLALIILLYTSRLRDTRVLHRLYSNVRLASLLLVWGGLNLAYYVQPVHSRLRAAPRQFGADFLNLFHTSAIGPSHPEGSGTARKLDSAEAFLNHYRAKVETVRAETLAGIWQYFEDSTAVVRSAEEILARQFTLWDVTRQLPKRIDWYDNPTDDEVWLYALDEFEWLSQFSSAYILTKDEKYAVDFGHFMSDYFEQISLIGWKDELDPVWRLIGAGLRMSGSWVDAFYVFLESESLANATKIEMLAQIHDQAQFLYHFRSPRWNHLIQESYGLMKVAVMFPEFKMAQKWLGRAVYRLDKALRVDVYPDGGYTEASTFYHRYVVRLFQQILDYAESHDVALPPFFYARFEEMYAFLMYTSRPDGSMPPVNDGFHAKALRGLFEKPAKNFDRDDFQYFATAGESGRIPSRLSIDFPYTGLYVMRSDWTDAARFCIFDGGLFGSAHGHEDKLSFEIQAYGSPLIVESGTFTYVYNDWHHFFESSFSHNTIVVDGRSQLRQPYDDVYATDPHEKLPNVWISDERFDFIESSYDTGYGNIKEDISRTVTHTRRMLFIKPDYWILWDILRGAGEHSFEQLFHFAPMPLEVSEDSKAVRTRNSQGANLLLYPFDADDLSVRTISGQTKPIQGWVSNVYGTKTAAPTVIYSKRGTVPATFVTVIYPVPPAASLDTVEITPLPVFEGDRMMSRSDAIGVKVATADWTDYLMVAPGSTLKRFSDAETRKNLFHKRVYRTGRSLTTEVDLPGVPGGEAGEN